MSYRLPAVIRRRAWRRFEWAFLAERCWCGWYPKPIGKHDPRFIGHGPRCPVKLFGQLADEQAISDQWNALEAWARAVAPLGDLVDWQAEWRALSWSLAARAEMAGVSLPVPDDVSALC